MDLLLQNIRVGIRNLSRTRGFVLTAVLTLAIGIGLSTAVFTVADTLLLRRLPVQDQDRLVVLSGATRDGTVDNYPLGFDDAQEFARQTRALQQVAFFAYEGASPKPIREGDMISHLGRALVSGEFFSVLGAHPVLGRSLSADDDQVGSQPVLVLSYRAWRQRFGGDPEIVGRQVLIYDENLSYTIVGVMPQGFDYPSGAEAWAPVVRSTPPANTSFIALYVIGRLAPGATAADAGGEMTTFFGRPEASPWQRDFSGVVHTLPQLVLGDVKPAVVVFAAASVLLLLITCVNVASLLLVRGQARVREFAVRSALGAGRSQVIGQLLTESALLAVVGGALGLAVAKAVVHLFVTFAPVQLPRLDQIALNGTALAAAVGITGLAMLIFALAPAILTSRVELQQVLRSDQRQSASRRSRLVTEGLVAGQIALALLVLSAAGLIGKSLVKLEGAELSFESSNLLIGELALRADHFDNPEKQVSLLERLLPELQAIPGVLGVSPVVALPFSGSRGWDGRFAVEGQSAEEATTTNPMVNMELVSPEYFLTLGLPIVRGRGFNDDDVKDAPAVIVVSQTTARHFWPNADPIGKRLRMGPDLEHSLTVVGVVSDTRYRSMKVARPSVYFPVRQSFFPFAPTMLAIRTSGPSSKLVPAIRRVTGEIEAGVKLATIRPFESFLEGPLAQPRLNALLLAVFAGAAVMLAGVGMFGVMATMVRQRTREFGVRMALGASGRDLRWMVVRRGLTIAAIGSSIGLIGAVTMNRLLSVMLYDVTPTDVGTLTVVTSFLIGVAAIASLIPAQATVRIDAVTALRAE